MLGVSTQDSKTTFLIQFHRTVDLIVACHKEYEKNSKHPLKLLTKITARVDYKFRTKSNPIRISSFIEMESLSIESKDCSDDKQKLNVTADKNTFNLLCKLVSYQTLVEVGVASIAVILAFSLSVIHFKGEYVKTLVPYSSISSCDSYSEMFNLAPQTVQLDYPITMVFTYLPIGISTTGYASAKFTGKWKSCLRESIDNNFELLPETNISYLNPVVPLVDITAGSYETSVSTNDGCFQLSCGFEYSYYDNNYTNIRRDYESLVNSSLFFNLYISVNDEYQYENGTAYFVDNQVMASISGTNNSVIGTCGISLDGDVFFILTQSNAITNTGTYLCKTYTSNFQAISSALSITLSVIGLCRVYFTVKNVLHRIKNKELGTT